MKTQYYAAAILLTSLSSLPVRADEPAMSKTYSVCMDASGGVTSEMVDCITAEHALWDKRLNASYKKLLGTLTPELQKKVRNSQRIWLQHREANCNLYMEIFDGSGGRLQANSCSLQMLAARTLELEGFIL